MLPNIPGTTQMSKFNIRRGCGPGNNQTARFKKEEGEMRKEERVRRRKKGGERRQKRRGRKISEKLKAVANEQKYRYLC